MPPPTKVSKSSSNHSPMILSSEVIHRGSRPAGYGFVTFKTLGAAEKAVTDLNDKELEGRPIIVQLAKPASEKEKERNERRSKRRATGRRNARAPPGEVTEAEAEGQAEESKPGLVEKAENAVEGAAAAVGDALKSISSPSLILIPLQRKGKGKKGPTTSSDAVAEGEQTTETPAGEPSAAGADAVNGAADSAPKATKKPRTPRAPRPPRPAGEQPEGQPSKNMLFVANLAFSVDDARLKQIFTDAGINVVSARVVTRRWGARRSKGFGFVDVGNEEEQKKALAHFAPVESGDGSAPAGGKEIDGRQIAVKVAVDAPKREAGETDADAAANSAEKNDTTPETTVVMCDYLRVWKLGDNHVRATLTDALECLLLVVNMPARSIRFRISPTQRRSLVSSLFGLTFFGSIVTVAASSVLPCPARSTRVRLADSMETTPGEPSQQRVTIEKRQRRWIEEKYPSV
ncbi:RNA recognition motif domain-containing protein [Rhizoctonia solani AG-1 IA]|uniref:RNA recognition motif domain-containing protein n=1 Tax=Thanatephorus cucumeris (strain AG1-IA) TaxID=983506 RepID=L8WYB3_THACA|nr:RNA recognition motif domain-containing protein [Rhizoctonia solani AG-1 IA]